MFWSKFDGTLDPARAYDCQKLTGRLGQLAPILLTPAVLKKAGCTWRRRRALTRGEAQVLVVWEATTNALHARWVKPAFLLGFKWEEGPEPSGIPDVVQAVAREVRQQLGVGSSWSLRPHPARVLAHFPWKDICLPSAFISLAVSLALALKGLTARPDVLVTAGFDPRFGPQSVGGVAEKVGLARQVGAHTLFVPAANLQEALQVPAKDGRLMIKGLPQSSKVQRVLEPVLAQMGAPPERETLLKRRLAYYMLLAPRTAPDYYHSCLLDELLQRCRARSAEAVKVVGRGSLVTFASRNPESCLFGIHTLQPKQCLLLYSADSARGKKFQEVVGRASKLCSNLKTCIVDPLDYFNLKQVMQKFASSAQAPVVADITGGPAVVSAVMGRLSQEGLRLVYLEQDFGQGRLCPGKERLQLLDLQPGQPPLA